MKDQELETILDAWADDEGQSAPEMRPTAEMYRMVRARKGAGSLVFGRLRWAPLAATVAVLAVLAVVWAALARPFLLPWSRSTQQIAQVGLREGFAVEPGVKVPKKPGGMPGGIPPGKGPRRGAMPFWQLEFQFQRSDLPVVEAIDLQAPQPAAVMLTADDNYRLLLEPGESRYITIYQLTSSNGLVQLFPHEAHRPARNPLSIGQETYVPSEPNWFHLGQDTGQERLHVIASAQPMQDLEELYARYRRAVFPARRQELLARLVETLDVVQQGNVEGADGWVVTIDHR
jgi:hypothetical protein